jgi:hypothetical protein
MTQARGVWRGCWQGQDGIRHVSVLVVPIKESKSQRLLTKERTGILECKLYLNYFDRRLVD